MRQGKVLGTKCDYSRFFYLQDFSTSLPLPGAASIQLHQIMIMRAIHWSITEPRLPACSAIRLLQVIAPDGLDVAGASDRVCQRLGI